MTLKQIVESNISYVVNSGYTVETTTYSTVSIDNGVDEESWFLQGDEADNFIDEADKLYNETDLSIEDIFLHLAYKYIG